jgi:adenylate cyclase
MEAPPLERKLIAILAADVAGYSRLMGVDEEGTLATLSAHRALTDALISTHGGRICGTAGDSILAEFASVVEAVQCAIEIQEAVARANDALPDDRRMWFRIGINVGDVMVKDGDIFGDGVNIAARLQECATPGGTCISRGVRDQIKRKLPYGFEDLGEQKVKNIAQPIRMFRLLAAGEEPPPMSTDAPSEPAVQPDGGPQAGAAPNDISVELVFWESMKESTRAADYEAYLKKYPGGSFAELARARIEALSSEGPPIDPATREVELAFWESARDDGSAASLRAYLEKYPAGEFTALAEIRLRELDGEARP